jgi:lipopolysaccharide/colanic/teichoic acid biosynthesis glycosyltransferase
MMGDTFGTQDDSSVPKHRIPAQRTGSHLVAPITLGQPHWRSRYHRFARAVNAGALGTSPVLYLLWRDVLAQPLIVAAICTAALVVVGHVALRARLHHLRRHGRAMSTILAVGSADEVGALIVRTRCRPGLGWRIDAACTPTGTGPAGAPGVAGVPVIGDLDTVAALALNGRFDAVSVAPAPGWTAVRLQHLAWDLDCTRTALLADRRLAPLAGPRVDITAIAGLPLVRLDHPSLRGVPRVVKGTADRLGALVALVLIAPILLGCAIAVRRDGGPALHRRTRMGRGGREFTLLTFRTTDGTGDATRVGRFLHRHCLDELPQLLNVLGGSMALVGPRPSVPVEPGEGGPSAHRRLLVKPGITGLWHVGEPSSDGATSGLDLRYVAEWTPVLDARILVRTVRAALSSAGTNRTAPDVNRLDAGSP